MTVIITGITGQDGHYMAELHHKRGDTVIGVTKVGSSIEYPSFYFDIRYLSQEDFRSIDVWSKIIDDYKPDIIYNFAAQSSVSKSNVLVNETLIANILHVSTILEAINKSKRKDCIKFFQPSSSEAFSHKSSYDLISTSSLHSYKSIYAVSKIAAQDLCKYYRTIGVNAYCGILFPHESIRRQDTFATGRFAREIASILKNNEGCLEAGNINVERIIASAEEVVAAVNYIVMNSQPGDYIVSNDSAFGLCTLKEFIEECFKYGGYDLDWFWQDETTLCAKTLIKGKERTVVKAFNCSNQTRRMQAGEMAVGSRFLRTPWQKVAKQMIEYHLGQL